MTSALPLPIAALLVGSIGFLLVTVAFSVSDRQRAARCLLWLGAIAPFLVTVPKTAQEAASGAGALDIARGLVPLACLVLVLTLRPTMHGFVSGVSVSVGVFVATCLLSAAWSADPRSTVLKAALTGISFTCLAVLAACYETLDEGVRGLAAVTHALLLAALAGLVALPSVAFSGVPEDPTRRLSAVVPSIAPNLLAWLAGFGLLLLLLNVGPRWAVRMPGRALLAIVYSVELLATRTRTSLVLWGVVLALVALRLTARRVGAALGVLAAVVSMSIAAATLSGTLSAFFQRGQSLANIQTLTGRTVVWQTALDLWHQRPLTGYGYYAGHRFVLPEANPTLTGNYSNIDNTWLEVLLDVGLIGLVALLLVVVAGVIAIARAGRATESGDVRALLWATTIAFLLVSFVNPTIQSNSAAMVVIGFVLLLAGSRPATPATGTAQVPSRELVSVTSS